MFLILSLFCVLFLIYAKGKLNERYWKKRNVKFYPRNKVLGIFWDFLATNKSVFEVLYGVYKQYPDEPAVGLGTFSSPVLYVLNPVNVQHVLATDFTSFNHRGIEANDGDKLADNVFFLNGKKWKLMRQSLSPIFTGTKLKSMFYIMDKSAKDFVKYFQDNPDLKQRDMFNTLSTFCSAAITATVFGINTESTFDSPFLKLALSTFRPGPLTNFKFAVANASLPLFRFFRFKLFKDQEEFFIDAIKKVIRQREQENVKKHDFADMCVTLQSNGLLKDSDTGTEVVPTDELLAAQAFFFFIAGVEPTAAAMFATLLELGRHPEVLQRVQKEIDNTFDKYNGNLTHEAVTDLDYLEMVMSEASRLHPSVGYLTRQCVEDTVLPVGNIKVDKGTKIFTPIFELHHDEKYYSDPEKFDPERFSKENRKSIKDSVYLPFGRGNRICIGMRYAQLQAKSGLVHLLRNYSVKTTIPEGGLTYQKEAVQVRIGNAKVEILDRNFKKNC